MLRGSFRLGVAAFGRNDARANCTSWCGDTRGLCVQKWFGWAMNVPDYRSSGAAVCCARIHQHWFARPSPIVVPHALVVAEPRAAASVGRVARRNSFEIQIARSVCAAVRTVLCKDARQMRAAVDSGCNESAQLMRGLSNHGVCRLPWKFTALWRCLGDGGALGTHAPLALERRGNTFRFCPSGGISVNSQRQISHNQTCGRPTIHIRGLGVIRQSGVISRRSHGRGQPSQTYLSRTYTA